MKHEVCECGHCRCAHVAGYMACELDCCMRYTWPGSGADLPETHAGARALREVR